MTDAPAPSIEPPAALPAPSSTPADAHADTVDDLRKEAYTMGLYVAICLLGALIALPPGDASRDHTLPIIWGVTVGLAMAHWFSFRVSSYLIASGNLDRHDVRLGFAQLTGAAGVAVLASIAVILFPKAAQVEVAELTLAGFIGLVGFGVARGGGASRVRAVLYAFVILAVAVAIAIVKNALAGH